MDRVFYSSSVHDEREIEAVVEVLRSGPQGLWPGRRVNAMERQVSALFGKSGGVMVNSGSSALYLAVELLGLEPGTEVVTCGLTFSTDIAPLVRAGLVPVLVDCEVDTYCVDVDRVAEMVTPRTGAMLFPNLVGNAPDWDALRGVADAHGLPLVEDSCDTLGPLLRGRPTGERSDITVTSFANSHILTAGGNGGMLLVDDEGLRDRALMLRRWGRRSEVQFYGSKRGERDFWEDLDGVRYDNQFIFDELAWNFEPSEMGAAFGLVQLAKLEENLARRRRLFAAYTAFFGDHADRVVLPRQLPELETAWLGYPLVIRESAGFDRPDLQAFLDGRGIDTRTIWTGNVARQPMLRDRALVLPDDGLPHADEIMARGVLLPLSHAIDEPTLQFVVDTLAEFLDAHPG
ncbi:DegT/DnrJ/EryC1/StrS family aminotransferase [Rhabdothermincola salaria]|uniref:DegT/DnrJ/EryC1/StrS family aminotransferase n=1 Tax=Rhabdothermincola salaria TaxID=2903142 RepID=UPI001E532301|nr:DegT/DnrJ/EryC1/StrS family aminotransferase [Rhabdothermincola salaria]MCD9624298.1 DegT/DnrJ/EryC1/StrS family aminotransferase [Rhabdothermincola salaria]